MVVDCTWLYRWSKLECNVQGKSDFGKRDQQRNFTESLKYLLYLRVDAAPPPPAIHGSHRMCAAKGLSIRLGERLFGVRSLHRDHSAPLSLSRIDRMSFFKKKREMLLRHLPFQCHANSCQTSPRPQRTVLHVCVCVHLCVYVGMFARTFHESAKLCACKGCNYLWPCDMSLVLTFLKCLTCLDSLDMLWIHSLPSLLTLLFSCVHWAYWVHCFPSKCIFWADWDCWVELDEFAEC